MRKSLLSTLATATATLAVAAGITAALPGSAAQAITAGAVDTAHTNVGALVVNYGGRNVYHCTATLVSPTVLVTAAHCITGAREAGVTSFSVTFDGVFSPSTSRLTPVSPVVHPGYNGSRNSHDLAVLVAAAPISGVTPARLPAQGAVATADPRATAVGYGMIGVLSGNGGPTSAGGSGTRRATSTETAMLTPTFLHSSQRAESGGTCYGDSGGPKFARSATGTSVLLGVTAWGDRYCRVVSASYRLDTVPARSFLGKFVQLP